MENLGGPLRPRNKRELTSNGRVKPSGDNVDDELRSEGEKTPLDQVAASQKAHSTYSDLITM